MPLCPTVHVLFDTCSGSMCFKGVSRDEGSSTSCDSRDVGSSLSFEASYVHAAWVRTVLRAPSCLSVLHPCPSRAQLADSRGPTAAPHSPRPRWSHGPGRGRPSRRPGPGALRAAPPAGGVVACAGASQSVARAPTDAGGGQRRPRYPRGADGGLGWRRAAAEARARPRQAREMRPRRGGCGGDERG